MRRVIDCDVVEVRLACTLVPGTVPGVCVRCPVCGHGAEARGFDNGETVGLALERLAESCPYLRPGHLYRDGRRPSAPHQPESPAAATATAPVEKTAGHESEPWRTGI